MQEILDERATIDAIDGAMLQKVLSGATLAVPAEELSDPTDAVIVDVGRRAMLLATQASYELGDEPVNQPGRMIERIVKAYQESDPDSQNPATSLDQVIARYGINLHRFRSAQLSPYDEVCLLKAAAIAGFSRDTKPGLSMARKAMRALRHEANNIGDLAKNSPSSVQRILRSLYASAALDEIFARDGAEVITTSIDEVLHTWRDTPTTIAEGEMDEAGMRPELPSDKESKVGFRRLMRAEAEQRMQGLQLMGDSLANLPDRDINVRYFETIAFDDATSVIEPQASDRERAEVDERDQDERTPYFSSDYVLTEVTERMPDGEITTHIIAESPNYGNACYVLRGDTLKCLSETLKQPITWQEVFSYPKITARQLGAKDFRHTRGANVPERVLTYFEEELKHTMKPVAKKWFTGGKMLFDNKSLLVTRFNRLPVRLVSRITPQLAAIRTDMLSWLDIPNPTLVQDSQVDEPDGETVSIEDVQASLARLVVEHDRILDENKRLSEENERLASALDEIRGIVS